MGHVQCIPARVLYLTNKKPELEFKAQQVSEKRQSLAEKVASLVANEEKKPTKEEVIPVLDLLGKKATENLIEQQQKIQAELNSINLLLKNNLKMRV